MKKIQDRAKRKQEANAPRKFAEIDLSVDIKDQPIAFAQWYCDSIFDRTVEQLKIDDTDPEVIKLIEETHEQQRKIMEQGKLDWSQLANTYITI